MRPLKIKILVPLIVFVLGMCSVGVIVWLTDRNERHEQQVLARLNASAYAERVRNQLLYGVQRTIALPSLSKYFLIANQEGTEKINGHPISARKEKSNPRENPFQGDYG